MNEVYGVNRVNAKIVDAVRDLGELSIATRNLVQSPSKVAAERLIEAVRAYADNHDELLASVEDALLKLQENKGDQERFVVSGVVTPNGIKL